MTELDIKGATFTSLLACAADAFGAAFTEGAVARAPDEVQKRVRTRTYLAGSWYPVSQYRSLLRGLVEQGASEAQMRALGAATATRDVTTLYRVVFSVLSPELVAKQSPRLFGLFYRGATVTLVDAGPGFARVEYTGCAGFDRWVWLDFMSGSEAVLALTGAKDVRTEVESGGTADSLRAVARWTR